MTRLTLSVPGASGRRAFKSLVVHNTVEGKNGAEFCAPGVQPREEVGVSAEQVSLLRGDVPPDCTGCVADVLLHCMLAVNMPSRKAPADWLQALQSARASSSLDILPSPDQ